MQKSLRLLFLSLASSFIGGVCPTLSVAAITYAVTDLGTLGGAQSAGQAINESGQITGWAQTTGSAASHAFLWTLNGSDGPVFNLQMKDLDTLGGTNSYGSSINASGQVAGRSDTTGDAATHAFRTVASTSIVVGNDLGSLGGTNSRGIAINDAGQVTGWSEVTVGNPITHAFLTAPNASIVAPGDDLGTFGGPDSVGLGINAAGRVVGEADLVGATHAFFYDGVKHPFVPPTLGGTNSQAAAINASRQITGESQIAGDGEKHAFLYDYDSSVWTDLGTLGGNYSHGADINDDGDIVGTFQHNGGQGFRAFLYSDGVMNDLNDLISPVSGWELVSGYGINNAGAIVGQGFVNGELHGFLLTSVPEPTGLLTLCGACLLWRRRRV